MMDHAFRQTNECANCLAQQAHWMDGDLAYLREPPMACRDILDRDRGEETPSLKPQLESLYGSDIDSSFQKNKNYIQ